MLNQDSLLEVTTLMQCQLTVKIFLAYGNMSQLYYCSIHTVYGSFGISCLYFPALPKSMIPKLDLSLFSLSSYYAYHFSVRMQTTTSVNITPYSRLCTAQPELRRTTNVVQETVSSAESFM